jgi:enoyl-[acyl-carrier-protein] reductase (NADH)
LDEDRVARLRAGAAAATPLQVASTAEDVAGAAVFLASPAARHVTGETLLVDAGSHLGYAPMGMR